MTQHTFPITPDVAELAAGVARFLLSRPAPVDLRTGVALQDLLGLAFDAIEQRIELGLRATELGARPKDPSDPETDPLAYDGPRLLHS